jgi:hypothetical protein
MIHVWQAARRRQDPLHFHVGSALSALRVLTVSAIVLALSIGFIAELVRGPAPRATAGPLAGEGQAGGRLA